MKKALLSILILLLAAALCLTVPAAEDSKVLLTAQPTRVAPGGTLTLTLSLSESLCNLASFEYYICYDPTVLTPNLDKNSILAASTELEIGTPPAANYEKASTRAALTVSAAAVGQTEKFTLAKGDLAKLVFTASADAAPGTDCGITLTKISVQDNTFASAVTVSDEAPKAVRIGRIGDANCDGKVDVGDLQAVYQQIRGTTLLTEEGFALADTNEDGGIDETDRDAILKILLPSS